MNKLFFVLGILIAISSCTNNTEDPDLSEWGYEYFPLETGRTWTYQSDSIIYTRGGTQIDTLRSVIREEAGEFTEDAEGNRIYKIHRSFRKSDNDPWQRLNTWTAYVDKIRAVRTEENVKLVKLVFPVEMGKRFDGNIFVDKNNKILVGGELMDVYKDWRHRIEEVNVPDTLFGREVSLCQVQLVDDESVIDKRQAREVYARGIGLIHKSHTILELDPSKINLPWNEKITRGFIHQMTLIDYQ
jgi:hypothetical protein